MTQQQTHVEQDARDFGERWAAAERRCDDGGLARILTSDFMAVGPLGFLLNRDQWLARYTSGELKHTSFAWTDVAVRVYGQAAVLIGRQAQESTYQDRPTPGSEFRATLFLVQQEGEWRLAGAHLSPIAPAG